MSLLRLFDFVKELKDIFNRETVVEPFNLFEAKNIDSLNPTLFDSILENGATLTLNTNISGALMNVTSSAGSRNIRQKHGYVPYQPGNELRFKFTVTPLNVDDPNYRVRFGAFDDVNDKTVAGSEQHGNGPFWVYNNTVGAGWELGLRSYITGAQVDKIIAQGDWSEDPLDGTGNSGINIDDPTQGQIFFIEYAWLGRAPVRYGVFDNDKGKVYCHIEKHAGVKSVYMSRGSLPVRWECENLGSGAIANYMVQECISVDSMGGNSPTGIPFHVDDEDNTVSVGGVLEPVISIRLKQLFERRTIEITNVSVLSTSNGNMRWILLLNGTLNNPIWNDASNVESGVEFDVNSTTIAGGRIIAGGNFANNTDGVSLPLNIEEFISSDIAGNVDIVTVAMQSFGAGEDVSAAISGFTEK